MTHSNGGGFTRVELLSIVAVLFLLLVTLLPGIAKSGIGAKALQCLENHRRLCNAWHMYAEDNRDRIVYAGDDGTGSSNPLNQYAWTTTHLDFNSLNRGNWDINWELARYAPGTPPLWPYMGRDATMLRCPSDESFVVFMGVARPRVRSVAMNLFLGGFAGTDGGWPWASLYRVYQKTSEFSARTGPADKIFVFLDLRPDLVNWGNYITDMTGYDPPNPNLYQFQPSDMPGMYHDGAASFSFVDGHCETKQWLDARTTPPLPRISPLPSSFACPGNPDVYWLQDHSTRRK